MSLDFNRYPHLRDELYVKRIYELREASGSLIRARWEFDYQHPDPVSPKFQGEMRLERYFHSLLYLAWASFYVSEEENFETRQIAFMHSEIPVRNGEIDTPALLAVLAYQELPK